MYFLFDDKIIVIISILNQTSVTDPGISKPGGGGPGAVESLGSGDCFDTHQHIPYIFLVGVEN